MDLIKRFFILENKGYRKQMKEENHNRSRNEYYKIDAYSRS